MISHAGQLNPYDGRVRLHARPLNRRRSQYDLLPLCGVRPFDIRVFGMELDMCGMVGIIVLSQDPEERNKKYKGVPHVAGL